ncbi:MAG TPA: hypothetical protein VIX12_01760, partial [Candidatus Binataceae bacterium]
MNLTKRRPSLRLIAIGAIGALLFSAAYAAAPKGPDVEIPFEAKALKASGLTAPAYVDADGGNMVVSDRAGGVYSVTFGGAVKELASKAKVKYPAGVAVAPAGFGSYASQKFVLTASDKAGPCEVDRIDASGAVSTFAKLPDANATGCRDLAFGPAGKYAGKLYAVTNDNAAIYAIDASGKAALFGQYEKPMGFELTTVAFAPATDSKAPGLMLIGARPTIGGAAKIGRISVINPDGKMQDNPYLVGFTRASGFAFSPSEFGSYGDTLFIADAGKTGDENVSNRDGQIYRVYKDVSRPFGSGLVDPTAMRFIGKKMVICDPDEKAAPNHGAIVVVTSL